MVRQKYSGIGGQTILKGTMAKNGEYYACAMRREDGGIAVGKQRYMSFTDRYPLLRLPLARGIPSFVDSVILGMQALDWPAEIYAGGDESATKEKPPKFEAFLEKTFNEKAVKVVVGVIMTLSSLIAIDIFMPPPMFLAQLLKRVVASETLIAILGGVFRALISACYTKAISQMEDIHRISMYHDTEHKRISCVEHGLPLTVENVTKGSREHKRYGTSFILIVVMISILFFIMIRLETLLLRVISRTLLMPVIAGVSYELPHFTGTHNSALVNTLSRPGMWVQGLTTRELTPDVAEVAMQAVRTVFDWKDYLRKNFSTVFPEGKASA